MKNVDFVSVLRVVLYHCHMDMRRMPCSANSDSFNNVYFGLFIFQSQRNSRVYGVKCSFDFL